MHKSCISYGLCALAILACASFAAAVAPPTPSHQDARPGLGRLKTVDQPAEANLSALKGTAIAVMASDQSGSAAGTPPGTQVYKNVVGGDLLLYRPGTGQRMADDMTLAAGSCTATYYSIRVAGLNQGGAPTFDVQTALWNGNPCLPGSSIIAGTQQTFTGVPNNQSVFDLEATIDPMVPIPGTVWLAATFNNNDAGWVRSGQAEVGSTTNVWSENHIQLAPEEPATGCNLFNFSSTGTPWAGFWAQINCNIPGTPSGACCNGITCTVTTQAACSTGVWQGAFTSCNPNVCLSGACCTGGNFAICNDTTQDQCASGLFHPGALCSNNACGPNFRVYQNNFDTGIYDTMDLGTKWADDLALGSGAPCGLASYETLFAGDSSLGPATFNVHTELWTNNDQGTPAENDDLPGALIPGTQADFHNLPANLFTQRLLAGPFNGIPLPEKVWLVMSTSSTNAGPVNGGYASIGFSADEFAVFDAPGAPGVWTGHFWYPPGHDPQGCPGAGCNPAGSFRITVWCEGNPPTGACCNDSAGTCTDNVPQIDCNGRWAEEMSCGPTTFDPPCGASACCFAVFTPDPVMLCLDQTAEECQMQTPPGAFKLGQFCPEVECPQYNCLNHIGDCFTPHGGVGCEDAFCCDAVCNAPDGDPFCCETEWDDTCAMAALNRCERPLENDNCADALTISGAGTFEFDNEEATTDGPIHFECSTLGGDEQIIQDVWYCWTSPCTTQVLARTCGATSVDTKMAVYEGCTCPPTQSRLLDCDDDRCAPVQSMAAFDAVAGQQYLIRLGSYPGEDGGTGSFTITCGPPNNNACPGPGDCCVEHAENDGACSDERCCETVCLCDPFCCSTTWDEACAGHGFNASGCGALELCGSQCSPPCPDGGVSWISPTAGIVDARIPHTPNSPTALQGIKTFAVQAPAGSDRVECWDICETAVFNGIPNEVESVVDEGRGRFLVTLKRPITPGAATTLTHLGTDDTITVISHPANVNSNTSAAPSDILDLVDHLNGVRVPLLTLWQCDIDRSGVCAPADILSEIDLLNGTNGFQVWNGTAKPATAGCP